MLLLPVMQLPLLCNLPTLAVQDLACSDKENTDTADSDDSGVDTEKEWLNDSQLAKLAQRFPSKVLEVMVIEVLFFFFDFGLKIISRGHCGRLHLTLLWLHWEVQVLVPHPQSTVLPSHRGALRVMQWTHPSIPAHLRLHGQLIWI